MGLGNYFDLKKSFPFYGAYHNEGRNQLIHVCCVPFIWATALCFVRDVRIPGTEGIFSGGLKLPDAVAAFYAGSFLIMDPVAGALYAPVLYALHHFGTVTLANHVPIAVGIHVFGWVAQFIGHGVFEGRKPALFDNLLQSIHAAVFFVWLEVLFALGYRPALRKELDALVKKEMAKFKK